MTMFKENLLICRDKKESLHWLADLKKSRFNYTFFPVFTFSGPTESESRYLDKLCKNRNFDWLILSSKNGVKFFAELQKKYDWQLNYKIALVGSNTRKRFTKIFNEKDVLILENNLQDCLLEIADQETKKVRILSLTSSEGLKNLKVDVPENVELQRELLYHTVPVSNPDKIVSDKIRQGFFDAFIFSSPSSFKFFRQMFETLNFLENKKVLAIGKTTQAYLCNNGLEKVLLPELPEIGSILNRLEKN